MASTAALLPVLAILAVTHAQTHRSFNILHYGAVPGGQVVSTDAIKRAVHAAASCGQKAHVIVPAGVFLSGSFSLASSVHLEMQRGSVLLASVALEDYPEEGWDWDPAFIDTANATDTGILGSGEINGQALPRWVDHYNSSRGFVPITWEGVYGCIGGECRPKLVRFTDCNYVTVQGVTLTNSPDWTSLYRRCNNVNVHSVHISGDHQFPNNDGIDIESGSNISIRDVMIDVGDDAICISSGNTNPLRKPWWPLPAAPVTNLTVHGASIRSKSSAIKFSAIHFGNFSQHNDMHSMLFKNIRIWDSSRGIGFQQRSGGGSIYNLTFDNISIETLYPTGQNWWGSGEPIWMTSIRQSPFPKDLLTGTIRDVLFRDIDARAENSILLSGFSPKAMDGIVFDNVSLTIAALGNTSCSKGVREIKPTGCRDYRPYSPSQEAVRQTMTSAIYFEGIGSVALHDVSVRFDGLEPYWVPADQGGLCTVASSGNWTVHASGRTSFVCKSSHGAKGLAFV